MFFVWLLLYSSKFGSPSCHNPPSQLSLNGGRRFPGNCSLGAWDMRRLKGLVECLYSWSGFDSRLWNGSEYCTCEWFSTQMRRLTTGIRSEKCVLRRFRRFANVIECTYTNLDSIAYCSYTTNLNGMLLHWIL